MTDRERALMVEVLNYVTDHTYCGADAEWHFKPGYDPQLVLAALAQLKPTSEDVDKEFGRRVRALRELLEMKIGDIGAVNNKLRDRLDAALLTSIASVAAFEALSIAQSKPTSEIVQRSDGWWIKSGSGFFGPFSSEQEARDENLIFDAFCLMANSQVEQLQAELRKYQVERIGYRHVQAELAAAKADKQKLLDEGVTLHIQIIDLENDLAAVREAAAEILRPREPNKGDER